MNRPARWWRDPWCQTWLVLALVIRVAYAWNLEGLEKSDPVEYDAIGWNVAQGNGFTNRGFGDPESWVRRPPGYPLFLGGVYYLFGHDLFAARMAQCAVGALLAAATIAFAARVAPLPTVRLVAVGAALYPYLVYYSGYVMSENVATLLFYAALGLLLHDPTRPAVAFASGVLLGGAGLTRSLFLGFLAPLALWLRDRCGSWSRARHAFAAVALGVLAIVSPWIVRNYHVTGRFIPVQTDGVASFYRWHVWFSEDEFATFDPWDGKSWEKFEKRHPEIFQKAEELNDVELDRYFAREAVRYVVSDPVRYLRSCARKFLWLWRPSTVARSGTTVLHKAAFWVSIATYAVWLPAFVCGLVLLWRRGPAGRLLVWVVAYVTAFHTFYWYGSPRFRFPMYPAFLIACVLVIEALFGRRPPVSSERGARV